MEFFKFLQKNRLFVHYLTLIVAILGVMTLFKIQREARPNVNFNRVAISAAYPGASPSDIEDLVINPIEEKLSEVDGIKEYRSVSFSGAGSISVLIDDEYPSPDKVIDEIRRKISEVRNLPQQVENPLIHEIKAINIPVLKIALYGSLEALKFKQEVEKLRDFIKSFPGVQSVDTLGLEDLQLKIQTDPKKLDQHDLTLMEVISNLSAWSKARPGGLLESATSTSNITIGEDYSEIAKLARFIVRSNDSGQEIQLKDVAKIEYDTEKSQKINLFEGKDAVLITIVKKPFADAIKTVDIIKKGLDDYEKELPKELKFKLYSDESTNVRARLKTVGVNAVFGLSFVIIILIIFLDWRSALVTSAGLPVAILGGVISIYLLGNTMNTLVIVGMIIVLGMLVDDAIVVCENIFSHIESGMPPHKAAVRGVSEIATPVVATVLTTVFAFFPILFMKEIMGQFLRVIPLTIISMLLVSLVEALVILPIHAEEIMRPRKKKESSFFISLERRYERYLRWSLRHRVYIVSFLVLLSIASFFQGRVLFRSFTLFPAVGIQSFSVKLELAKNAPLSKTTLLVKDLSQRLLAASENTMDALYSTIGETNIGGNRGSRQNASNLAMINVVFTSDPDFIYQEKRIIAKMEEICTHFASEYSVNTSMSIDRPGPPMGKPIHFEITTRDLQQGPQIAKLLKQELAKIKGVRALETDLDGNTQKYRILINNSLAISEGVDPAIISQTIFAATTGRVINDILINNEKVELLVSINPELAEQEMQNILALKVRNKFGQAVPIETFAQAKMELGPSSIQRLNGLRTITVFGEVDEKIISGKLANTNIRPYLKKLKEQFPHVVIVAGGGEKDRLNALKDTLRLYILAVILIFMTISLSFQSILYPFLVLLAVPMGLVGVVWALMLHNHPPSLMALVGVVGLSGVVVNVSIILLKFIQERIAEGMHVHEAIVAAGVRRLRPIFITTVTTMIGLIPTIYGIGGVDTFVMPLALVLGWGLLVATLLTLFTLPALLALVPGLELSAKQEHEFQDAIR